MVNDNILIEAIDDSDRLRPIDDDHVKLIARSIDQQGLLQPIRVRPLANGLYRLVLGAHRLAALKSLNRVSLTVDKEVLIAEASDYSAKVDEIDENLSRHELNALDRALFLAQRKEFYLLAHPEAAPGGDRKSKAKIKSQTLAFDLPKGFGAQAAKKCGLSKATINQAVRLAEKLNRDAAKLLRGTKIERNQCELLAIAALEPERQIAVAQAIKDRKAKTIADAKVELGWEAKKISTPEDRRNSQFRDIWRQMSPAEQARALGDIGAEFKASPTIPTPKGAKK